jgi:N utilization substance protein B
MSDKPPRASKKARLTAARLAAVQALYQQAISGLPLAQVKSEFLAHYTGVELDGDVFVLPDESHWLQVLDGVEQYSWQMDQKIDEAIYMAQPERKTQNVDILLRLIMRCGCYELENKIAEEPIIINDYMNVAKAFYQHKEPSLINAVLDQIAKSSK